MKLMEFTASLMKERIEKLDYIKIAFGIVDSTKVALGKALV